MVMVGISTDMAFNQFLGTSPGVGGGGAGGNLAYLKGDKGDPGLAGPPDLAGHLGLEEDHLQLKLDMIPSNDLKADLGSRARRFRQVHTEELFIGAGTLHVVSDSGDKISISHNVTGTHIGRSNISVQPSDGQDFTIQGVVTSKQNPDKIDPEMLDISGLRFRGTMSTQQDNILEDIFNTIQPALQAGDYFVFDEDGRIEYPGFTDAQNDIQNGDIVVFSNLSPEKLWAKVPFRIPSFGVNTQHLQDGAVTSTKLHDGSVTTAKLQDGAVDSFKLAENVEIRGNLGVQGKVENIGEIVIRDNRSKRPGDPDATEDAEHGIRWGPKVHGTWRINATTDNLFRIQIFDEPSNQWITKLQLDGLEDDSYLAGYRTT
jgi:hypothetical protein